MDFLYGLGFVIAYFVISILFNALFYKGRRDKNNWQVFNLSSYAELGLTCLFLTLGIYEIVNLINSLPIWYQWIIPILWCLYLFNKSLFIFRNRNNYLMFQNQNLKYKTRKKHGNFFIDSYKFLKKESASISYNDSWFLFLKGHRSNDKKNDLEFDLKNLNLEGYKNAIEKYFNSIDLPKH